MKNNGSRQVLIFVIVGLSVVSLMALLLWRMALPTPVNADPEAVSDETVTSPTTTSEEPSEELSESSAEETPRPSPDSSPNSVAISEESQSGTQPSRKFSAPRSDDPFLAPHAVAGPKDSSTPTEVYRPEAINAKEPTPAGTVTSKDTPSEPIPEPSLVETEDSNLVITSEDGSSPITTKDQEVPSSTSPQQTPGSEPTPSAESITPQSTATDQPVEVETN